MAASACLRSRIALSASPGLDTFERSNLGFASTTGLLAVEPRFPLKYSRTLSAWSASMELEWVFPGHADCFERIQYRPALLLPVLVPDR